LDLYDLPPDSVRPGTTLREIIDLRFAAGSAPAMSRTDYLRWRQNVAVSGTPTDSAIELSNGRVVLIRHRPMPDGSSVATHEDLTERHRAEKALTEAMANAERAEQAARVAHTTLIDALDVVPEGLAIFDADDRLVLFNRRYAELYDESADAIAVGMTFE